MRIELQNFEMRETDLNLKGLVKFVFVLMWIGLFCFSGFAYSQNKVTDAVQSFKLVKENIHDAILDIDGISFWIKTTGNNPYIYTDVLQNSRPYFAGIDRIVYLSFF